MRRSRHFPQDEAALRALVHQAVEGADRVVLQAGHFLLYHDTVTGTILPCLAETMTQPHHAKIREEYAAFPVLTWRLGLRLLASLPAKVKRVMVVVNDWQYLPRGCNRADFYANHAFLPGSYAQELARYADDISLLEPERIKTGVSTAPFFGEMNLRNRYQRHVEKLIAAGTLPPQAVLQYKDDTVFCTWPDAAGVSREVYCSGKSGDCAGEIAEMIHEAGSRTGASCFINLYPLVCRELVERGSQMAMELFGSACDTVLNLGFQSAAVHDEKQLIESTEATWHGRTGHGANGLREPSVQQQAVQDAVPGF